MKPRILSLLSLGFLILCVGIGIVVLRGIAAKQSKDNRWKVAAAFKELETVFPTSFKKNETGSVEPDLALIVETMNAALGKATPTRSEKEGAAVELVPYEPMRYQVGRPDAEWQMVLTYEKESRLVKADAYGVDLSAPVSTREYPCCHW